MNLIKENIEHSTNGLKGKSSKSHAVFLEFFRLNGAVIDALEYYLYMKSLGVDIKLCVYNRFNKMYSPDIQKLFDVITDRYDIDFDYKSDVKFYQRKWDFIKDKYDTVLIVDRATIEIYPMINANRIIYFHDYCVKFETINTEKLYSKLQTFDHIKVYHEMPFAFTREFSTEAKLKMAFTLYKKQQPINQHYFMNYLSKGDVSRVLNILDIIPRDEYLFITANEENYKDLLNIKDERLVIWDKHPKNFFSKFKKYIYCHDGEYFDPRPRMFHECAFYDKAILYINDKGIEDGSWYRYNDVINNPQAVQDRTLTPDDTIIKEFL